MRISIYEKDIIACETRNYFGEHARAFLFGSRVSDVSKGGDIDLLIIPDDISSSMSIFDRKISFQVAVKRQIGDRKIDVIVKYPEDSRGIVITALSEGVEL